MPLIVAAIDTVIPSSPLTKRGAKGETRFFRTDGEALSRSFTTQRDIGSERIIDVLGMGRQTVIPPTLHPETGAPYQWVGGATIFEVPAQSLPLLPADFLDSLEQALQTWLPQRPTEGIEDHGFGLRPHGPIGEQERKRYEGYFKRAFTERLKELATTSQGSRNEELFRLVCYLGKYVRYGIVQEREFFSGLEEACRANGLARQDGLPAIRATIRSGLRASRNDALPLLEERAQGHAQPETATSANASDPWPELRSLIETVERQPYPLHALPMLIQNAVREVQAFVQAPMEMVAMSALSAMSAALQAHRDVRRSSKLVGPISLWHLTVAESGERKTSLDRYFSEAIRDYERRKAKEAAPEVHKAKDQAKNWAAQEKGLLAALTKARKEGAAKGKFDISQIEQQLDELRANAPIMPRVPLILRGDDTSESLAYALSHEWPSAAVLNSEAGLIFGSHAMGPEKVMAALAQKNVFWDGGDLHIGRRTSESFAVRGARFTFGLQIQRAALWTFVQKSGELARGIGFWARFLFAEPESTQGTRLWKEPPKTWVHLAKFRERLALLLDIEPVFDALGITLRPPVLDLSPEGKAAWVGEYNAIETALAFDGPFTEIKDVASKAADNIARLAALFHIFELGIEGEIEAGQVGAAAEIIRWHLNESLRFFGSLQLSEADKDAADLEEWLLKYCRRFFVTSVPRSEVQKGINPRKLREGKVLKAAIEKLRGLGRVRPIVNGKQTLIQVRPELLTPTLQAAE